MNVPRLFRRRPATALCNVADHFFGQPDDLPCRDTATVQVSFHCPGHGPRLRKVCDHHADILQRGGNVGCEVCALAGDTIPVTFVSAGAP